MARHSQASARCHSAPASSVDRFAPPSPASLLSSSSAMGDEVREDDIIIAIVREQGWSETDARQPEDRARLATVTGLTMCLLLSLPLLLVRSPRV